MEYYLSIDGTEFVASQLEITGEYRRENQQMNLAGDLLIDRIGKEKITLKVKLNLIKPSELNIIRTARRNISCSVSFYRGILLVTKTMHIKQFTEPSPIYFFGDMNKGVRYGSIELELEEL